MVLPQGEYICFRGDNSPLRGGWINPCVCSRHGIFTALEDARRTISGEYTQQQQQQQLMMMMMMMMRLAGSVKTQLLVHGW